MQGIGNERLQRYRLIDGPAGRTLRCEEAPGIEVRIDAGFGFSEADARKLAPRAILLDGAGQFPPLVDRETQLYNLDHHAGCIRAFTLATCEQALVLVAKGVDLGKGDWTLFANEPDLDTVLAIWVLLNHRRVVQGSESVREVLIPLVRVEGAIDANGTSFAAFCGVAEPALAQARERLELLLARDQALRRRAELGPLERTAALLSALDNVILSEAELREFRPVNDLFGHVSLNDDLVAVACRDRSGVYDVESRLRDVWGARLGLVVLENRPDRYTLRASGPLGSLDLGRLYPLLNLIDPAVGGRGSRERWGGSDDIGGSPREHGSALSPQTLLRAARHVYARPRRLLRTTLSVLFSSASLAALCAAATLSFLVAPGVRLSAPQAAAANLALLGGLALLASVALARRRTRHALWVPAWRRPAGRLWWLLAPFALVAGALGGSFTPSLVGNGATSLAMAFAAALVAAIGLEAWLRGFVQGLLMLEVSGRVRASRWQRAWPGLCSAVLHAGLGVLAVPLLVALPSPLLAGALDRTLATGAAALSFGLLLAMIRQSSRSLWPGIAVQTAAIAVILLVR